MAQSPLTTLRSYAQRSNPATLPDAIHFAHTDKTLTVFDLYPKSIFHFLILPRVSAYTPQLTVSDLANLRTLLKADKDRARKVIEDLDEAAKECKQAIEEEMLERYKFKWDVWIGFHPVPSMEHIHLHVMSGDLCSTSMKNKKHYNSFHPKAGFFLKLKDVVSWFDAEPSFFSTMSELKKHQYEPLLKDDLSCFRCREPFKTMPKLKEHLQEEFNKHAKREKAKRERLQNQKRKREEREAAGGSSQVSATSTNTEESRDSAQPEKRRKDEAGGS